MRALSIKQPWLYCITDLDKNIENRTWRPPNWIIGKRIALHASKVDDKLGTPAACELSGLFLYDIDMPRGAIVATAILNGWIHESGQVSHAVLRRYLNSKWFSGPCGWVLDDVQKVSPGPAYCKGSLGLWKVPPQILV